jgi:hypothetical protein
MRRWVGCPTTIAATATINVENAQINVRFVSPCAGTNRRQDIVGNDSRAAAHPEEPVLVRRDRAIAVTKIIEHQFVIVKFDMTQTNWARISAVTPQSRVIKQVVAHDHA